MRLRMRELTADLFISLDGFASGVDQSAYFGCYGQELGSWVRDHIDKPKLIIMGAYLRGAGAVLSIRDR
jgi:hypothetical protein